MIEKTERLRRKYISANTKQYEYASYMDSWRRKVERVGNLNYPEEARKLNLSGSLQLEVALNRDGTINEITLRKSSGKKVLDDAAIKIVELAAPYAAFPENIEKKHSRLESNSQFQIKGYPPPPSKKKSCVV